MAALPKILIAPLDWGLGHATRCIPVIKYLQQMGCSVYAAASGSAAVLLQANFPDLEILSLEGYNIHYSRSRKTFAAKILFQVPKILKAIRSERNWLKKQQAQHDFDLIISDNRYGLRHRDVFSVIMTHQLQIQSGQGRVVDWVLRKLHYPLLQQFDQCWVVDNPGINNIGGTLSHPAKVPSNVRYIGLLSQIADEKALQRGGKNILMLLSGPEPMRGILEAMLLQQAKICTAYTFTVAAGNPGGQPPKDLPVHIQYYNYLGAEALQDLLASATLVICRSGYSTLMDLAAVHQKALLIPTPGQAEQGYLGRFLMRQGLFLCRKQELLQLKEDIATALEYPGFSESEYYDNGYLLQEALSATGQVNKVL